MSSHDARLAAARGGDSDALTQLVMEYHDKAYRYGRRVCASQVDAEDAVQEAFLVLSRRPDVQRGGSALSWLLAVIRTTCIKLLRPFKSLQRGLGRRIGDPDQVSNDERSPDRVLDRWRVVRAVHECIASLEPSLREVLILRDLEGLSAPEVASLMGLTEEAVKSRLHRARNKMRERIRKTDACPDAPEGLH
jgi:RNA polymerase sigma-70 factor (ECF subfamily)